MPEETGQRFFVGRFTESSMDGAAREAIHLCRLDTASGALHDLAAGGDVVNPSYLALGPRLDVLYAVQETSLPASVHALRIRANGDLVHDGQQPVADASPCHLSVHPNGRLLAVVTYGGGTVALYPLDADGRIAPASSVVQHRGQSVHPTRQEGPHAHAAVFTPDGTELFVPDLGLDEVKRYRLSPDLLLEPLPSIRIDAGSGPRHLVFRRAGDIAYVVNELTSSVAVATRGADGWSVVEDVPCAPSADPDRNAAAAIRLAPSERFLYASVRGHDSIAVFAVDHPSGRLSLVQHVPTGGATPRDFDIDPSGRFLVVANQDADELVSFWIDPSSGRLEPTGQTLRVAKPACVLMR